MLIQILTYTPPYVWATLAALIGLGLMQARERRVATLQVLALPLVLLGLGLWSMAPSMAAQPLVIAMWLGALILGAVGGRLTPQVPGTVWLAAENRLRVPGSWMPMAFIVVIFVLRYAAGVGSAMHTRVAQ